MPLNEELIKFQQQTQDDQLRDIYSKLWTIHEDVSALKVKAGLWGAAGGFLTAVGALVIYVLKGKM